MNQHQNSPNYGFIHLVAPVVEKGQAVPPALPSNTDQFEPVTVDVTEQEGYVKNKRKYFNDVNYSVDVPSELPVLGKRIFNF